MKKKKLKPWVLIIAFLICLTGVIYYSYKVIAWKLDVNENKKIQESLKDKIQKIDSNKETHYKIDFKSLKEQNPDTIAYIKVNNTNIDYIVVKGKNNSYYLNHNFEKKWNIAGWVFADYRNKLDETDKNIIIYGHNTKDGSMFDTLKNVLEEDWYQNKENHKVTLVTEKETYIYEVFSTYSIVPENYYISTNFENEEEYSAFLKKIQSRSIYNYKIEVTKEDKILTLSSCLKEGQKRVVLHAKLIQKG